MQHVLLHVLLQLELKLDKIMVMEGLLGRARGVVGVMHPSRMPHASVPPQIHPAKVLRISPSTPFPFPSPRPPPQLQPRSSREFGGLLKYFRRGVGRILNSVVG